MATIYDVAKRARVSTATVSAVLNGTAYVSPELTSRVNEAVKELDYTINAIARGLQTRRTNMIGMLVPDIAEPVYSVFSVVASTADFNASSRISTLVSSRACLTRSKYFSR